MGAAQRSRARDRRPLADTAEPEKAHPGGGPRRRALGSQGSLAQRVRLIQHFLKPALNLSEP